MCKIYNQKHAQIKDESMKRTETITATYNRELLTYFQLVPEQSLFLDIETTGLSPTTSMLYLIGVLYYNADSNVFECIQWFNETGTVGEEKELLNDFFTFVANYRTLIHYNGDGFDIPYLTACAKQHRIPNTLSYLDSFDIYKKIRPLKKLLNLPQLKQKSIEQFLQIDRKDTKDGGELIAVYKEYTQKKEEHLLELLLLHNADDIKGMLFILPILHYIALFDGAFSATELFIRKNDVLIHLHITHSLPKPLTIEGNGILFTAAEHTATLQVPVYQGELKYFYSNYKDYYYLPLEDTAIHKSVAAYVDKQYRTQAKASNCYSRKTGLFLPQPEVIITPYYKSDYKNRATYFEITEEESISKEQLHEYVKSLLQYLYHLA